MAQLNTRVKASSLIESLIAMVIIVVCFSIAVMIYVSIMDSDQQRKKMKAILWMNEEVIKIKRSANYIDNEINAKGWTLKKTVEQFEGTENVFVISLAVKDKEGETIAKRNELIPMD